ncbi:MAG: hypothetical protein E6Q88_04940 [Lysobacteraceae bacterium]|nr:MAG: hypothetical protein E6Q88_04940 [Xanthomonadaceae bacterium]
MAPHGVRAEDSERETPPEELKIAEVETIPNAAEEWMDYLQDLDRRYPDSGKVDLERFAAEEGEKVASLYCKAAGFDGPCAPEGKDGQARFAAIPASKGIVRANWWDWIWNHLFNVGVIPEREYCPAPYAWTEIYMDDEDRRNNNNRGGWLGVTGSNNNTAWRFCRLDLNASLAFRPLPLGGDQYDYAVLNMGIFCPSGARRIRRYHDNEDWNNANSSYGNIFPNVSTWPGNWHFFTCHFDGAASSWLGHMTGFPNIGMSYGVYAPQSMPWPYALAHGWVYQDDEDNWNNNSWSASPDLVMSGSSNTWRGLAKVK